MKINTDKVFGLQHLNPGLCVSVNCKIVHLVTNLDHSLQSLVHSVSWFSILKLWRGSSLPAGAPWSYKKAPSHPLVPFLSSCVHFACEAADCPQLAVENASLNCSSSDHYHGAQCTVSCRTGYVLQIQRDDELIKSQVSLGAGQVDL